MNIAKLVVCIVAIFMISWPFTLITVNAAHDKFLTVPDDFPTIQKAIDNAKNGDTIILKKGLYYCDSIIINKTLTVKGEDSCSTVLNGESEKQYLFPSGRSTISIYAPNVVLSGFNITNCDVAIYIGSSDTHIFGNNINHNIKGLSGGGSNIIISENNITNNYRGLGLSCPDSVISNNLFYNNLYALGVSSCENVSLYYNTIINNSCGLALGSVSDTSVFNNIISKNLDRQNFLGMHISSDGCGIYIDSNCNSTLIHNNNLWGNSRGVSLNDIHLIHGSQGSGNIFFFNNLFDNKQNANLTDFGGLSQSFSWDNGTVGNYWGDYREKYPNATQEDTLGIWNTPYNINNNNTDQYPLTHPVNITIENPPTIGISDSSQFTTLTIGIVAIIVIVLSIAIALIIRRKNKA